MACICNQKIIFFKLKASETRGRGQTKITLIHCGTILTTTNFFVFLSPKITPDFQNQQIQIINENTQVKLTDIATEKSLTNKLH